MTVSEKRKRYLKEWDKLWSTWDDLDPRMQEIAKKKYLITTGDIEGIDLSSEEFAMRLYVYDRRNGNIVGDDYLSYKQYLRYEEFLKEHPNAINWDEETGEIFSFWEEKYSKMTIEEIKKEVRK